MASLISDNEIDELVIIKPQRTTTSHYVDNKRLSDIMIEWRKKCDEAKAAGLERPRIPDYVGECILKMAESMGKRFNFRGYSFLDEMVSDAVLHVCKYIHNFNPMAKTKSGSPSAFSYINRIIWRSFTNRIENEDKNQYLKNKSFELLGGLDAFKDDALADVSDDGGSYDNGGNSGPSMSVIGEEILRRVYEYEEKHDLGPKKKKDELITEVESDMLLSFMEGAEEKKTEEENDDFPIDLEEINEDC